MPTYRAQIIIPTFSGFPTDVLTNTLHFDPTGTHTLEETAGTVTPIIEAFYESLYIPTRNMASHMRPLNTTVNWYNLSDPPPRAPFTVAMPLTVSSTATICPTE